MHVKKRVVITQHGFANAQRIWSDGAGIAVAAVCRKHGSAPRTNDPWKSQCAGASVSDVTRMRELRAENAKPKRMYAALSLENTALKDVVSRNW